MNKLVTTKNFHGLPIEFYKNDEEFLFTMEQVSQLAGYDNLVSFKNMIASHPELREKRSSFLMKSEAMEGGVLKRRERRFFTEEGLWEVLMVSGTPKGIEVRRFIAGVLKKLRKGELVEQKPLPLKMETSLNNLEAMAEKLLESQDNNLIPSMEEVVQGIQKFEKRLEVLEGKIQDINLTVSVTHKAMEEVMGELENVYEKLGD